MQLNLTGERSMEVFPHHDGPANCNQASWRRGKCAASDRNSASRRTIRRPDPPATPPAAPIGPFTLPALPYGYDALEPSFDAATMHLHHDKHHQTYVNNLNAAVAAHPSLLERLLRNSLRTFPAYRKPPVRRYATTEEVTQIIPSGGLLWARAA